MKEITVDLYEAKLISKRRKLKIKVVFEVDLKDLQKVPFNLFPTSKTEENWTPITCEEYTEILEALKQTDGEKLDETSGFSG